MYSSNKTDHHRAITRAYSVMPTQDICNLGIDLYPYLHDNCVLFMWTTDAHLPDALRVIKAWGFEYKTVAFIWIKKEVSGKQVCYMGQWTMKGAEIVLLAIRGKMTQYLKSRKVRQLTEATRNRGKHSQKPIEIKNKIVGMFGDIPRIELFARNKSEGWDCWGNEVDSDIIIGGCYESEQGVKVR